MTARVASLLRAAAAVSTPAPPKATEPHYTVKQVSKMWNFHPCTIRRIFAKESGVIRGKRAIRIPKSLADRKHAEMMT